MMSPLEETQASAESNSSTDLGSDKMTADLLRPSAGSCTSTVESSSASRPNSPVNIAPFPGRSASKKLPLGLRRGFSKQALTQLQVPRRPSLDGEPSQQILKGELNSYVLEKVLGHGSSSIAYRAASPGGSLNVIKRMRNCDPEYVAAIGSEFHLLQSLNHPNIIRARDVAQDMSWMALEFLDGSQKLWSCVKATGALHPEVAGEALRNLTSAVAYIHARGVKHRDVNPENVLLFGTRGDLRLIDFNAALGPAEAEAGMCLSPGGNPAYIAPEVLADGFGFAADVWGIGATIYFASCARFECRARRFFEETAWDAAPAALKRSIGQCLEQDPALRPTASALLEELPIARESEGLGTEHCSASAA